MYLKSVDCSKYIAIVDMRVFCQLPIPSSAGIKRGDGTVYPWKYYGDKVFETILRRQTFASMIIVVNDYYENDAINGKGRSVKKALLPMLVIKQKMYCCKGKTFSKYKRYQHFFPESTEQIPSAGFPEIIFGTEK